MMQVPAPRLATQVPHEPQTISHRERAWCTSAVFALRRTLRDSSRTRKRYVASQVLPCMDNPAAARLTESSYAPRYIVRLKPDTTYARMVGLKRTPWHVSCSSSLWKGVGCNALLRPRLSGSRPYRGRAGDLWCGRDGVADRVGAVPGWNRTAHHPPDLGHTSADHIG